MGAVTEHDAAKIRRCKGRYNLSLETLFHKERQIAGMIDMGMR